MKIPTMKMQLFQKTLVTLVLSVLAAAATAKAQLICNSWNSGGSSGQNIYDCNFSDGSHGGSYGNSYNCNDNGGNNYCTINFTGGNSYQGNCSIVFTCFNGTSYYCNINNWNGTDSIRCDNIPQGCNGVYVCQGTHVGAVPEPSTMLAGALLLIPLGISTARMFRKQKAVCHI
jgi:hypothetical protein